MSANYDRINQVTFQSMVEKIRRTSEGTACQGPGTRDWLNHGEVGVDRGHLKCLIYEFDRLRRMERDLGATVSAMLRACEVGLVTDAGIAALRDVLAGKDDGAAPVSAASALRRT